MASPDLVLIKISVARVITYGIPTIDIDKYVHTREDTNTTLKNMRKFEEAMIKVFGALEIYQ